MKKEEWNQGMDHLDPDLVEQYVTKKDGLRQKRKVRKVWLRLSAVAACFAVIVGAILAVPVLRVITRPEVPTWDNPPYTAEEISELFSMKYLDGVATNAYTKVYVPDAEFLYIGELSEDEYIPLYRHAKDQTKLSEADFRDFVDGILPALADSLRVQVPHYRIEENHYDTGSSLSVSSESGVYSIHAYQKTAGSTFRLYSNNLDDPKIVLDGETVQVDQRLSDEEIMESIQSIKSKLFDIFNVSFTDVRIIREYDGYSKYGAEWVEIYFFDEDAHPLNAMRSRPISDYICISFDNNENYAGDIVSNGILTVPTIVYFERRNDVVETYPVIAQAKRISLKEAEALLYNGYVFGGHSCPLCMAAQDKVSFDGYDFVDMEYVFGGDTKTGKPTMAVPFYAFYKKIGTSENGNSIYAKTYVAAIQVGGYEEYFNSQKDEHKNTGAFEFD